MLGVELTYVLNPLEVMRTSRPTPIAPYNPVSVVKDCCDSRSGDDVQGGALCVPAPWSATRLMVRWRPASVVDLPPCEIGRARTVRLTPDLPCSRLRALPPIRDPAPALAGSGCCVIYGPAYLGATCPRAERSTWDACASARRNDHRVPGLVDRVNGQSIVPRAIHSRTSDKVGRSVSERHRAEFRCVNTLRRQPLAEGRLSRQEIGFELRRSTCHKPLRLLEIAPVLCVH